MTNKKPYLLLDIDGVVNIFPSNNNFKHGKHRRFWNDWIKKSFVHEDQTFPFVYSPAMINAISDLREHYDIVWLTTWQDLANSLFSELVETNILESEIVERTNFGRENSSSLYTTGERTWWKISSLNDFIGSNPKDFVWLDDEYSKKIRQAVETIALLNDVNGKIIPIYEGRGVVPRDVEDIINYADSLKEIKG